MEFVERDTYISRIISGRQEYSVGERRFFIVNPTHQDRCRANQIYKDSIVDGIYQGLLSNEDVFNLLIDNGIWTVEKQKEYDTLISNIEMLKIKLFNFAFKSKEREVGKKTLRVSKERFEKLTSIKHSFDHFTYEGYANIVRYRYLMAASVRNSDGSRTFENFEDEDSGLLNALVSQITENSISEKTYRELARTEPWRSIWTAGRNRDIFGVPAIDLTEEQRNLISYSMLYDNIYESPDCPSDFIIQDDDMLDGWLITQRKKRETDSNKNLVESKITNSKIANANEVYIVAETPEDVERINSINSEEARIIKRQREKFIREKGKVNELQLPDVKRDYIMQRNQAYTQAMRNGR